MQNNKCILTNSKKINPIECSYNYYTNIFNKINEIIFLQIKKFHIDFFYI
jgi:hypothetical protein